MYLKKFKKYIGWNRKPQYAAEFKETKSSDSFYGKGFICSFHPLAKIESDEDAPTDL